MFAMLKDLIPDAGLTHVIAEYYGKRYYIASAPSFPESRKIAESYKEIFPDASFFITDRDCSINGLDDEFQKVIKLINVSAASRHIKTIRKDNKQ